MKLPSTVKVVEVGPRDGFQMESAIVPTELKLWVIESMVAAGLQEVEITSFVHPRLFPQLADAADLMARLKRAKGVRYAVLVPNLKGAERALAVSPDLVRMVVCATDTYNLKNAGLTTAQAVEQTGRIARLTRQAGIPLSVAISLAAGCPFEGDVPESRVLDLLRQVLDGGADEVSLADSAGLGHPRQIAELVSKSLPIVGDRPLSLHLHDTRGLGLANALAAMGEGLTVFDASFGGLGGCPTSPVATGNIATEDLVYLCEEMGVSTGIDLDGVRSVSRRMSEFFGRELPSRILQAGTRTEVYRRFQEEEPGE